MEQPWNSRGTSWTRTPQFITFFNANYYAQRVIGDYYIRKAQDHAKRGVDRVELHTS